MTWLSQFQNGTLFAKDFEVLRPLKEGGMGAVYEVRQRSTDKLRALKVMQPQLVRDAGLRQRFEVEARVAARIKSHHVVEVIGAGVDEQTGLPWLAMELLDGTDLETTLQQRGRLPVQETREIFAQLCHAMAAAHQANIVHRGPLGRISSSGNCGSGGPPESARKRREFPSLGVLSDGAALRSDQRGVSRPLVV